MSLKFILGSAGSGKTYRVLNEILRQAKEAPNKNFLVIVPEQFSMQTQDILTAMHPSGTILNVDVLSFNRLAYRVFEELGFKKRKLLEDTGKSFVLQKIALDHENDLEAFGMRLRKPGNIEELKSVISELMQYDISPNQLSDLAGEGNTDYLGLKLRDIGLIYQDFKDYLEGDFMVAEEVPDILCNLAEKSHILKDAVIAFDGFTGFTPIQMKLLGRLLPMTKEILVTADMDSSIANPLIRLPEDSLFSMSSEMICTLKDLAKESGTPIEGIERLDDHSLEGRFKSSESLNFLEQNIFRKRHGSWSEKADVEIREYPDARTEASSCALAIARLVREKGLRYRDIAILTGDLESYGIALKRSFEEEGIPAFIDEKRSLLHNPFVEYMRAALAACTDGYSYDSVFRFLKSGMTDIAMDDVNRMENYVLAFNINSKKRWRESWTKMTQEMSQRPAIAWEMEKLNENRERLCTILDPLSNAMADRKMTVREKMTALYTFCVQSSCQEKLKALEEKYGLEGRQDLVREYAQIYGKVMEVLDKLVSVLGDEKMSMGDLRALIETGLSEIRIGIIPPGTDQVMVGDMERSRLKNVRVLFFVGVNEGLVPKNPSEGGFLSETDRERMEDKGVHLKPSPRKQVYIQNFYLYLALTKPSEKLIISYATADGKGNERRPAYLISQIKHLFPYLEVIKPGKNILDLTERADDGITLLAEGIRNIGSEKPSDEWLELYGWYQKHASFAKRLNRVIEAAGAGRREDAISKASAKAVYGNFIKGSATRLEKFSACPFSYFAEFGLKLKEREVLELTNLDRGNVLHDALQYFGEKLIKEGEKWSSLDGEKRDQLSEEAVRHAIEDHFIYQESRRNAYEIKRLIKRMQAAVWSVEEQLKKGDFEPSEMEKSFDDSLKSRHFVLDDGTRMLISGRIDRIDICDEGDKRYIKVVDYKTGSKKFDLAQVYYGLQLQLVLYMNAVMEMEEREGHLPEIAGIYYQKVRDPFVTFKDAPTEEKAEEKRLSNLKEDGITSAEENIKKHLSHGEVKKSRKREASADAAQFRLLGNFADKKAREIGNRIISGEIAVSPYVYGDTSGCDYCSYKDLCGFDDKVPGCRYRHLGKLKDDEVFTLLEEDESGTGHADDYEINDQEQKEGGEK